MSLRFVFRVNASSDAGLGHLMRCRALAEELTSRGGLCSLVGPSNSYRTSGDDGIFKNWIPIRAWSGEAADARELIRIADRLAADRLILDSYLIRDDYQLELVSAGAPPWMHAAPSTDASIRARWIYNANPSARVEDYRTAATDPEAQYLIGPRYAMLRREFRNAPEVVHVSGHDPQVLLAFGGGDDRGATAFAIRSLLPLVHRLRMTIMTGSANPHNDDLQRLVSRLPTDRVRLLVDPPNVARLLSHSQVAVLSAGTITFEAAACGLPMVLLPISANQVAQAAAWSALGLATSLSPVDDVQPTKLRTAILELLEDPMAREERSAHGRRLVDGHGAGRVADALGLKAI